MSRVFRAVVLTVCILSARSAFAQGGACPSGANYWNAAGTAKVTLASIGVTSCYYASKSIGSDSAYDGTQETISGSHGPWAHIPGMGGCASNCAAVTPGAGYGFILRGGDTWAASDLNYVYHGTFGSGTASNWVYIGVDPSWHAGSSWTRPIFSCAGGSCSTLLGYNYYVVLGSSSTSYIMFDNIELTGLHEATMTGGYIQMGGPYEIIENIYAHGWEHTGASSDSATVLSASGANSTLRYSICDGSDTTEDMMKCVNGGDMESVYGNYMQYVTDGINSTASSYLHDNWVGPIIGSYQGTGHANGILNTCSSSGDSFALVYNNVMTAVPLGGMGHYWFNQSSCNTTWYVWNNIEYATASGNNFNTCQNNAGPCGTWYIFNNTFEGGGVNLGGVSGPIADTAHVTQVSTQYWINNHCFTSCTSGSGATPTYNTTVTETNDLSQTIAQADANTSPHFDQYTETETYPFSPVASTNSTVGAGTNEQSLCTGIAALNAAAGAACQNSTGFACSYNTSSHSVSCPADPLVARPASGAWDAGAYQYGNPTQASSPSCSPGTGTYSSGQTVTCTNPNSGTTVMCYRINATPATNGLGTACATGTAYTTTITVSASETLNVIAGTSTLTDSTVSSYVYTLQAATPTFSPAAGSYGSPQSVSLSDATPSVAICFTTDGSTPTEVGNICSGGTTQTYSTAILISTTATIKALATLAGYTDSAVASATYTIGAPPVGIFPATILLAGSFNNSGSAQVSGN